MDPEDQFKVRVVMVVVVVVGGRGEYRQGIMLLVLCSKVGVG